MTACLIAVSCHKKLNDRIDGLNDRVEALEELCKEVNTNVASLQDLLEVLKNNDMITGVTAITKDGEVVGYTITFKNADPITIYSGVASEGEGMPQIGVKKGEDGLYYWTIDGEFLLDESGNKIKAEGTDSSPQFKVDGGFWYISYDGGKSWELVGPASGDGSADSLFVNVEVTDNGVIFTLVDGTQITVPTSVDTSYIDFLDNTVELLCIMNWDANGDDKLSFEEAAAVKSIGTVFKGTNIISFNEFKYFTSVKRLESRAFDSCKQLRRITLPESLEEIAEYAFCTVSVLSELEIPASVTLIEDIAICICPELTKLTVNEGNKVYDSRNDCNAIIHTETDRLVIGCNTTIIPEDVETIAQVAFWSSKIENVIIPDSVTSIEYQAFRECSNLKTVSIGKGVKNWGVQVFSKASGDYWVNSDIPDSPSYDQSIFYMSTLSNLTIGPDVTTLGTSAFSNCKSLKKVVIPKNVVNLRKAFADGTTISDLEIDSPTIGKELFKGMSLVNVVLGENVETIEEAAFKECKSLQTVVAGNKLKTIGKDAFHTCRVLTSINFGSALESIGENAFYNNYALTDIVLPSTVTSIGASAFYGCSKLASVVLSDNIEEIKQYTFYECKALNEINMPKSLKSVGLMAFYKAGVTSLIFPETLAQIDQQAFAECTSLQKVEVNSTIDNFGTNTFYNSTGELVINAALSTKEGPNACRMFEYSKFSKVVLGNAIKEIPDDFFSSCEALADIEIPEGLETIGSNVFWRCKALKSIKLPSTLKTLGANVFDSTGLESIEIPEGVQVLPISAFRDCASLVEVKLPDSLIEISQYAMAGCVSLKEVTIPKNVTTLGKNIFSECKSYISLYSKPVEPPVLAGTLGTLNVDIFRVYVPTESVEKYKSSWSSMKNYIYEYNF